MIKLSDRPEILKQLIEHEAYQDARTVIDAFNSIEARQTEIDQIKAKIEQIMQNDQVKLEPVTIKAPVEEVHPVSGMKFERKLAGGTLDGTYINEKELRKLSVIPKTGDVVQYDHGDLKIIDAIGTGNDDLIAFDKVIVKYNPTIHRYYFDRHANGDRLNVDTDQPLDLVLINEKAQVNEGDIIDYAFYNAAGHPVAENASNGIVRWKYPIEPLVTQTDDVNKTIKKTKNKSVITQAKLDMDLTGKSVLIITSMVDAEHKLTPTISRYNPAKITFTGDWHSGAVLNYENLVKNYDVVIICTDLIKHAMSRGLMEDLRMSDEVQYATATKSTANNIERALYRAVHGLPAYETSGSTIDYQTLND